MSTIKTNRIQPDTNGATLDFVIDQKKCITAKSTEVRFATATTVNGVVTVSSSSGVTSDAIVSCSVAPTQGQHLCNKNYVDTRTATVQVDPNIAESASTSGTTFPWTYTFPANTFLIYGHVYHSMTSSQGSQCTAQFMLGTTPIDNAFVVSAANEFNGGDGGRGFTIDMNFLIAVPAGATSVVFSKTLPSAYTGYGTMQVWINQTTPNSV